ncbi:hypothetical protein G7046_g9710 [Stylonectria norvegica]|nr:hypothetical protein G7046_g9710 [Stylonectria norvegica]
MTAAKQVYWRGSEQGEAVIAGSEEVTMTRKTRKGTRPANEGDAVPRADVEEKRSRRDEGKEMTRSNFAPENHVAKVGIHMSRLESLDRVEIDEQSQRTGASRSAMLGYRSQACHPLRRPAQTTDGGAADG